MTDTTPAVTTSTQTTPTPSGPAKASDNPNPNSIWAKVSRVCEACGVNTFRAFTHNVCGPCLLLTKKIDGGLSHLLESPVIKAVYLKAKALENSPIGTLLKDVAPALLKDAESVPQVKAIVEDSATIVTELENDVKRLEAELAAEKAANAPADGGNVVPPPGNTPPVLTTPPVVETPPVAGTDATLTAAGTDATLTAVGTDVTPTVAGTDATPTVAGTPND